MKRIILTLFSILMIAMLSACGSAPAATPTISVDDIRATAAAKVAGDLAQTQAALPTATDTPVPPTSTEQPIFAVPTATSAPFVLSTNVAPTPAATAVCNQVPPVKPQGALAKVRFINKSGGQVSLSFGMISPNDKGECVTYGYTLGIFSSPEETILAGCYWGYAWISGNKTSTAHTTEQLCFDDPSKAPSVWITTETIDFH